MRKDLRGREALRNAAELTAVSSNPAFATVNVTDLRKLAELVEMAGTLEDVTLEIATAFGGTSRHRLQCARRVLAVLAGEDHPATLAVAAALSTLAHGRRKGTHHRDHRTRQAILAAPYWAAFRTQAGAGTTPLNELRAIDRYLVYCTAQGVPSGTLASFLAFVEDKSSSMLLRTLRDGLENLLSSAHPAVAVAEEARSRKEAERSRRRKSALPPAIKPDRPLEHSISYQELPDYWREILERLESGKRVDGRRYKPGTVENMVYAARQLLCAARDAGLPDEISLDTVRAYDAALEVRKLRPSSRNILFSSLGLFAPLLHVDQELLDDLSDLATHYAREARYLVKLKENRLALLPDLKDIFQKANELLDRAASARDRRRRQTLYVDAAALAFLSLIPLRNQDTVLRWGEHITYIGDDDPADWGLEEHPEPLGYFLDLSTSKKDVPLSGPLAPILTPFLDTLILQGRDERLLPQLRQQAVAAKTPVFPKTGGRERRARSISSRWYANLGTGSGISRTRIHTLLGAMGENGVRAALALCAQCSPRTAKWYQTQALARREMSGSQEMIIDLVEPNDKDLVMLAGLQVQQDQVSSSF